MVTLFNWWSSVHILRELTFFLTNMTREPPGQRVGQIKPLSNRSFSFSLNSLNTTGAILYGEIKIVRVSRMMSMRKSISILRGTPGRSWGKTSRNSFTIVTDWGKVQKHISHLLGLSDRCTLWNKFSLLKVRNKTTLKHYWTTTLLCDWLVRKFKLDKSSSTIY